MAKPAKIELFEGANVNNELEENTEVKIGRKKTITVRVTSADNANQRTGVLIRYFAKVDGIPIATYVLFSNQDNAGQQFNLQRDLRVIRGAAQSVRVIAWDRKGVVGGEVQTKRVRIRAKVAPAARN